jgi:hypothetical protein
MGHEQASTTTHRYPHTPDDYAVRIPAAFDSSAASLRLPSEEMPSDVALIERSRRNDDPRRGETGVV